MSHPLQVAHGRRLAHDESWRNDTPCSPRNLALKQGETVGVDTGGDRRTGVDCRLAIRPLHSLTGPAIAAAAGYNDRASSVEGHLDTTAQSPSVHAGSISTRRSTETKSVRRTTVLRAIRQTRAARSGGPPHLAADSGRPCRSRSKVDYAGGMCTVATSSETS